MSDPETRERRGKKFRNPVAKELYENKGAFAIRVLNPKKTEYKRKKMRINEDYDEEDSEDC